MDCAIGNGESSNTADVDINGLRQMLRAPSQRQYETLSVEDVLSRMAPAIRRREHFVQNLAKNSRWSAESWKEWYSIRGLSRRHMAEIQEQWMWDLAESEVTSDEYKAKIEDYKRKGKKGKARALVRGRFRSYLEFQCGSKQLAFWFLMYDASPWKQIAAKWGKEQQWRIPFQ